MGGESFLDTLAYLGHGRPLIADREYPMGVLGEYYDPTKKGGERVVLNPSTYGAASYSALPVVLPRESAGVRETALHEFAHMLAGHTMPRLYDAFLKAGNDSAVAGGLSSITDPKIRQAWFSNFAGEAFAEMFARAAGKYVPNVQADEFHYPTTELFDNDPRRRILETYVRARLRGMANAKVPVR